MTQQIQEIPSKLVLVFFLVSSDYDHLNTLEHGTVVLEKWQPDLGSPEVARFHRRYEPLPTSTSPPYLFAKTNEARRVPPYLCIQNSNGANCKATCGLSEPPLYSTISDINSALENDDSVVADTSSISGDGRNYISDYLAFSDLIVHTTDGSSPHFFDGENNLFDFFLNVDSQGLTSKNGTQDGLQRKFSNDEDVEVSSTTSMSSVLGWMLNFDFEDQFDTEDSSTSNVYVDGSLSTNVNTDDSSSTNNSSTTNVHTSGSMEISARNFLEPEFLHKNLDISTEIISSSQHKCQLSGHGDTTCYASENGIQDEGEHNVEVLAENTSDGRKDTSPELPPAKHVRKQLLKTVVTGTANVGVLFFLLHMRSRGDNSKETKPLYKIQKFSSSKFSSAEQRKEGRMSGIYPAEKLKFGN